MISYPDLSGCITCGETVESTVANVLDAKRTWIEAVLKEGEPDSINDAIEVKTGIYVVNKEST